MYWIQKVIEEEEDVETNGRPINQHNTNSFVCFYIVYFFVNNCLKQMVIIHKE